MAQRFHDAEIWKERWFRKLPPKYKCFFYYIQSQCDHAGIWRVDTDQATFSIGEPLEEKEILELFGEHILEIDNNKWLIKNFVRLQCGEVLKPTLGPHKGILKILKRETYQGKPIYEALTEVLHVSLQDKDKDMDKEKEKDVDMDREDYQDMKMD